MLTEVQAAEFLGLSKQTLAVWRCTGRYGLPFVKVGRSVRYRLSDLEKFLADRTVNTTGEAEAKEIPQSNATKQKQPKKEKAEREAAEAKRREAMKPDLEKLRSFVSAVEAVEIPWVHGEVAAERLKHYVRRIEAAGEELETWIDEQAK